MAIRTKSTVTLKAKATCPSHSLSTVSVRDLSFAIDNAIERAGAGVTTR